MWQALDVIFSLKSPLHIGFLPFSKGSVISPTRYYVPAKNFWGAITKRLTENLYQKPGKEYQEIGREIKDNFRFSYFYLYDGLHIYTPCYSKEGLVFGDQKIDKFRFEYQFISSRVLTAIDSNSGKAKDGYLHEIEFIKDKFRDEKGDIKDTRIIGRIWIKNRAKISNNEVKIRDEGIFVKEFNLIEELTLGGEQSYGFGLVNLEALTRANQFPLLKDNTEENELKIVLEKDMPLLFHLEYTPKLYFQGEIEPLTGRGYFDPERDNNNREASFRKNAGEKLFDIKYCFVPGTLLEGENNKEFTLSWNGIMIKTQD